MVAATPETPKDKQEASELNIKIATPDIILAEESVEIEIMSDLLFEDIGGQEIISISRNDLVGGQNVIYQPIKNLTSLYLQYNPQNILSLQDTAPSYFKNFPIKLESKIPTVGTGPNGEIVYFDQNGNIVINVINLAKDEQVDVQIQLDGQFFSDTIYEVNE